MINYKDFTLNLSVEEIEHTVVVLPFIAFGETYFRTFINGEPGPLLGYNEKQKRVMPMNTEISSFSPLHNPLCVAILTRLETSPETELDELGQFQNHPA